MPLTQAQIDAINLKMFGDRENPELTCVNKEASKIIKAVSHLNALLDYHERVTDANATLILGDIKTLAKNAAQEIVTLLS